jgi:hypothetical protein
MPSVDRHWRLSGWIAIGSILLGVGVPLVLFITMITVDGSLSVALAGIDWSIAWGYAMFVVVGVVLASSAMKGRARQQLRERALIEWVIYPPGKAMPADDGAPYEEMRRRGQALVRKVIARAGLTPRTCQTELALHEDAGSAASRLG